MTARSNVTFGQLRQLLIELGFTESKRGKFWQFEHSSSGTVLTYRPYQPRERVTAKDLQVTRQDLQWRDLMAPDAFDDLLQRATA